MISTIRACRKAIRCDVMCFTGYENRLRTTTRPKILTWRYGSHEGLWKPFEKNPLAGACNTYANEGSYWILFCAELLPRRQFGVQRIII